MGKQRGHRRAQQRPAQQTQHPGPVAAPAPADLPRRVAHTDKALAVELCKAASLQASPESFVLHARSTSTIVAVFRCDGLENATELEEILKGLQRQYHIDQHEPKGEAPAAIDRGPGPVRILRGHPEPIEDPDTDFVPVHI